ncbi:MAG: M23 family metallopeptidase [Terrimesophilobacter sp.]
MSIHSPRRSLLFALMIVTLALVPASAEQAAGATTPFVTSAHWTWPVAAPHRVVRPFVAPETPYSSGHRGIDIAAPLDGIVRAPADGVIHFSGFVVDRAVLSINHGGGIISSFEPVVSELVEGTKVNRGDPIGALQPGHCRAPCLHLGVRLHGQYVSPLNYLGGMERSVLLPTRVLN